MKQIYKHEVYVTQCIGGKEVKKLLRELPELMIRVKEIEKHYNIQVTHCTYAPNRGNLLTVKYTERSDGKNSSIAA